MFIAEEHVAPSDNRIGSHAIVCGLIPLLERLAWTLQRKLPAAPSEKSSSVQRSAASFTECRPEVPGRPQRHPHGTLQRVPDTSHVNDGPPASYHDGAEHYPSQRTALDPLRPVGRATTNSAMRPRANIRTRGPIALETRTCRMERASALLARRVCFKPQHACGLFLRDRLWRGCRASYELNRTAHSAGRGGRLFR